MVHTWEVPAAAGSDQLWKCYDFDTNTIATVKHSDLKMVGCPMDTPSVAALRTYDSTAKSVTGERWAFVAPMPDSSKYVSDEKFATRLLFMKKGDTDWTWSTDASTAVAI
jgi:hypothetical protein